MSKAVSSESFVTSKTCQACGDSFSPEVSKVGLKYCSPDCLYDSTGEVTENCPQCGDEFLKEFTKTSIGCSKDCENALGVFVHGTWKPRKPMNIPKLLLTTKEKSV
jgi:hypothetical protein